jgi:hypothetical protein
MLNGTLKRVCATIVWSWLVASLLHGVSHLAVGAPLSPLPPSLLGLGVGVELFFSLGPLVALALLYTRWSGWGTWLLVLTMLIALLWGFGGHFLFPGGDNIITHMSSPGGPAFLITSLLVLLLPWAGLIAGVYALLEAIRQPSRSSATRRGDVPEREEASLLHAGR